jgi:hypothetical protein
MNLFNRGLQNLWRHVVLDHVSSVAQLPPRPWYAAKASRTRIFVTFSVWPSLSRSESMTTQKWRFTRGSEMVSSTAGSSGER